MKKFKFKFASILKLRKEKEEEALRELGKAQQAYQAELAEKARILAELDSAHIRRERLGIEPVGIFAFQLEDSFIIGTKQRIVRQDQAIFRATKTVEKALRGYILARRQTKMMETLFDKHHQEWRVMMAKKTQKEMDDLTIMRQRLKEDLAS